MNHSRRPLATADTAPASLPSTPPSLMELCSRWSYDYGTRDRDNLPPPSWNCNSDVETSGPSWFVSLLSYLPYIIEGLYRDNRPDESRSVGATCFALHDELLTMVAHLRDGFWESERADEVLIKVLTAQDLMAFVASARSISYKG